jgi:hypothetical protein
MEKLKEETHDKIKRYSIKHEDLVSILAIVDEAIKLVETELLPYLYKYKELCSNPLPESRVREEYIRSLFLK